MLRLVLLHVAIFTASAIVVAAIAAAEKVIRGALPGDRRSRSVIQSDLWNVIPSKEPSQESS